MVLGEMEYRRSMNGGVQMRAFQTQVRDQGPPLEQGGGRWLFKLFMAWFAAFGGRI